MAFISPGSSQTKEISTVQKLTKPVRNLRIQFKSPVLHSSLNSIKDLNPSKPLPEVLTYEKKPLHGRSSIIKNRTLPFLKCPESEMEVRSTDLKVNTLISDCKTISIRKKVKISIRNLKFQIKPQNKGNETPEIRLEPCEDLVGINTQSLDPKKLLVPVNGFGGSPGSSSSKRRCSNSPMTPATSERLRVSDPYFYLNYLRHSNITSFYRILEGGNETNLSSFPYFSRVLKKSQKIQQKEKKNLKKTPRAYFECSCLSSQPLKNMKIFKQIDLLGQVPGLQRVFLFPQDVKFSRNLIILNFEGVLGSFGQELSIKPGILKHIKKLSRLFRIALVVSLEWQRCKHVVSFIENQGIMLSAVYKTIPQGPWALRSMQEYSMIFKDFSISFPEIQTLVLCSHKIAEPEKVAFSDLVASKVGLSLKMNSERVPVPTEEFSSPSLTILLPNYQIREHVFPVKALIAKVRDFQHPEDLAQVNFKSLLSGENMIFSTAVHQVLIETLEKNVKSKKKKKKTKEVFCRLHRKNVKSFNEKFCENVFLI
jgi:hypothetical protein